jgi:hypothetical protein
MSRQDDSIGPVVTGDDVEGQTGTISAHLTLDASANVVIENALGLGGVKSGDGGGGVRSIVDKVDVRARR